MLESIEFTVGGQRLRLSREQVELALKNVQPGPIQAHGVEVGGVLHPVKEAFAQVTGLDLLDFNTNQARSTFRRLGFKVTRVP